MTALRSLAAFGLLACSVSLAPADALPPAERGIFLATTWRLHPDVCRFISDAVYDGRLQPEAHNARRTLVLSPDAHPLPGRGE